MPDATAPSDAPPELDDDSMSKLVPERDKRGHKGSFGRVLVLAGSLDYAGAALLVCRAAGRAGAGLVTLAVPESLQPLFAAKVVEATTMALPEDDVEEVDPEPALASVLDHEHDALVIGPGLRPSLAIGELLRLILTASEEGGPPAVLDAEALRTLAAVDEWWTRVTRPCVLTPHTGEFARLRAGSGHAAEEDGDLSADDAARARAAASAAAEWHQVVVLKGAKTVIASPDGSVAVAPFENPAMASGGTGDVLSAPSARCWRRAWRHTMRRVWASISTDWPARPCATGSGTPGCSPATCRRRSRSGASAWPGSPSARRRDGGSGSACVPRGPTLRPPTPGRRPRLDLPRTPGRIRLSKTSAASSREPIEARLAAAGLPPLPRTAWLELDLDALAANLATIRRIVGPGVRVEPVVKADAYGHGAVPIARALAAAGADGLSVATVDEAFELRDGGIELPLLVLYPVPPELVAVAAASSIAVSVGSGPLLEAILAAAGRPAPVARSTSRCTSRSRRASGAAARCPARPPTRSAPSSMRRASASAACWTHLVAADDVSGTRAQDARFRAARLGARRHARARARRRASPSRGERRDPRRRRRPLGRRPAGARRPTAWCPTRSRRRPRRAEASAALRPVMALLARPVRVVDLPAGHGVSYGPSFVTARPSRIATLPVGYGDGWRRALSDRASALVRGVAVPLVGRVAMDAVMADVTDVPGRPGDRTRRIRPARGVRAPAGSRLTTSPQRAERSATRSSRRCPADCPGCTMPRVHRWRSGRSRAGGPSGAHRALERRHL